MKFSLTPKIWKSQRPKCANGSGVAKALKLVEASTKKKTSQMSLDEIPLARSALLAAEQSMRVARSKVAKQKDKAKYSDFTQDLTRWENEFSTKLAKLAQHEYICKVSHVQTMYDDSFAFVRDKFMSDFEAAERAESAFQADPTVLPSQRDLQNWMGSVRDMNTMASKKGITSLSNPHVKTIRLNDLILPSDIKTRKAQSKDLLAMCEFFAKAIKKGTKNIGAGLVDTKKVEKDIKVLLASYKQILKDNKGMIQTAKHMEQDAKDMADNIKVLVSNESTTPIENQRDVVDGVRHLEEGLLGLREDNVAIHKPYRESTGALSRAAKTIRATEGYDADTHGTIIATAQSNLQISIRQVTIPLGGGDRQIERCKKFIKASNSLRGYL